jgi:lantibiotic biosynthesis protein
MNNILSTTWVPILGDELGEDALSAVSAIGATLPAEPASSFSLARGLPGRALFYAYADATMGTHEHLDAANDALNQSIEIFSGQQPLEPTPPGLFEGFAGLAWTLSHVLSRYGIDEDPNTEFDESLAEILAVDLWPGSFDLVYGIAGIGLYAVERLPRPGARTLIASCVRLLQNLCSEDDTGVSWFTPPELLPLRKRTQSPHGRYDLGVAHGAMGVIGFLAQCQGRGVGGPSVERLLADSIKWILSKRLSSADQTYPLFINDRGSTTAFGGPYWGWCYGDLGLAATLCAAGRMASVSEWVDEAHTVARAIAGKLTNAPTPDSVGIEEPGLCHGMAGIAHLFNRLFQATGDELFRDVAVEWFRYTLASRGLADRLGGFRTTALDPVERRFAKIAVPGFLEGAAGIGLALMAAAGSVLPAWDRLLLLDASDGPQR